MDGKGISYPEAGTPQGSVLSPVLANLYLNELDRYWEEKDYANRYKQDSHLIRYADDVVVLCPTKARAQILYRRIEVILTGLGLRINEEKSKVVQLKEGFSFLGFHFTSGYSYRKMKQAVVKFPSAKATKSIKRNIKVVLKKNRLGADLKEVVEMVNPKLRGWANYFQAGNSYRHFCEVQEYATEQLRLFLRKRYQGKRNRGYRRFPNWFLYNRLGLLYIPEIFSNRMLLKEC